MLNPVLASLLSGGFKCWSQELDEWGSDCGTFDAMEASEEAIRNLSRVRDGLVEIAETTSRTVVAGATQPELIEVAYAAIRGEVAGEDGRSALRVALTDEGMSIEMLDTIDALYVRCLLDPTIDQPS